MTALALYDSLASGDLREPSTPADLAEVVAKLIASALADYELIDEFDERCGLPVDPDEPSAFRAAQEVWRMYSEWLREAQQIFDRASRLEACGGVAVPRLDDLHDAIGDAETRLQMTPEQDARAVRQVRAGDVVPIEVLRDELRARLRG